MQEVVNCPSCQRKLQVPESLLGQDVQCPTCGATFVANWGNAAPPPAAPRPTTPGPPAQEPLRFEPPPSPGRYGGQVAHDDGGYDDYADYGDQPRRYSQRRDLAPHRGSTVLVLGILSLVIGGVGLVLGIMAWVMGNQDMVEMKAGRMDPEGESSTNAGRICGMIATILHIVVIAFLCLLCFLPALLMPTTFR